MDRIEALAAAVQRAERSDPAACLSVGLYAGSQTLFEHQATESHYAASTMKLPLLIAAHRAADAGTLDLDATVRVRNGFTSVVGGDYAVDRADDSDEQVWDRLGTEVRLRWLTERMIIRSSNLATNLVLEVVGLDAVAAAIRASGATGLQVVRGIGDYAAQAADRSNLVTARGLGQLLLACQGRYAARAATCAAVLDVLGRNEIDTDIRAGLPDGAWVAHKNGWVTGVVHDAALVRPRPPGDADAYVLVVCTTTDWSNDRAHRFIAELAAHSWPIGPARG